MSEEGIEKQDKTSEKQDLTPVRNAKGQIISGTANPNGRPLGAKSFTTKVREALEKIAEGKDYTYEEAFIKSILKKGIVDGDSAIIRLIWNYLDGMPVQKLVGDNENPLITIIKYANRDEESNPTPLPPPTSPVSDTPMGGV